MTNMINKERTLEDFANQVIQELQSASTIFNFEVDTDFKLHGNYFMVYLSVLKRDSDEYRSFKLTCKDPQLFIFEQVITDYYDQSVSELKQKIEDGTYFYFYGTLEELKKRIRGYF